MKNLNRGWVILSGRLINSADLRFAADFESRWLNILHSNLIWFFLHSNHKQHGNPPVPGENEKEPCLDHCPAIDGNGWQPPAAPAICTARKSRNLYLQLSAIWCIVQSLRD